MTSDTQLEGYVKAAAHTHEKLQVRIYNELRLRPATRKELAARLDKPINCLSAPVKELLNAGKIEEFGWVRHADTNCRAAVLRVKEPECRA